MIHVTALLLDLSNIIGGFLLGAVLLADVPHAGDWVRRGAAVLARFTLGVGIIALMVGGFYLIMHVVSGPHVFHFELVAIGVGVALLRDQLFPRLADTRVVTTRSSPTTTSGAGPAGSLFAPTRATARDASAAGPAVPAGGALLSPSSG
ncbi:MAG TPA: hypothetical protein VI248_20540 [Kineosporiaceae bacterium]